ncbi:MAG: hypothetical protein JNM27_11490 [Leptospirales bacterium]|nr:hypothetical protein [Leptospirales bacterium]
MAKGFSGAKYKAFVREKIPVRLHMSLILIGSAMAGVIGSKIMQLIGLEPLWLRYVLNVLVSYVFFLIFIKVWLLYISPDRKPESSSSDLPSDIVPDLSGGVSMPTAPISETFQAAGGNFGGAGSSGSWTEAGDVSKVVSESGPASAVKSGLDLDLSIPDVDEGIVPLLILLALGLLLAAVFGGAVFLVYQAPTILSEVALEFMLSAGLIKSARSMSSGSWIGSVLSRTWIPFSLITALAGVLGFVIGSFCPGAEKLLEAIKACVL